MNFVNLFIIIALLLSPIVSLGADGDTSDVDYVLFTDPITLSFTPENAELLIRNEGELPITLPLFLIEKESSQQQTFQLVANIAAALSFHEQEEYQLLLTAEGHQQMMFLTADQVTIREVESLETIRERIIISRKRFIKLEKELKEIVRERDRLREDVRLVGGFQKVEEVQQKVKEQHENTERLAAQVELLEENLERIKGYKNQTDLPKRKRVLQEHVPALQNKLSSGL